MSHCSHPDTTWAELWAVLGQVIDAEMFIVGAFAAIALPVCLSWLGFLGVSHLKRKPLKKSRTRLSYSKRVTK